MPRKPLGGLSINVPGGQRGPRGRGKSARFAEKPTILATPEQLPQSSRPETEERKSAFMSRTREAGQTPYKYGEGADQSEQGMETPMKDDSIFRFDYGYHSAEVTPKVEIYEDFIESGDAGNSDDDEVEEMEEPGEQHDMVYTNPPAIPIVDSGRKQQAVESPTSYFSPCVPVRRATPTVDSPSMLLQSVQNEPRSSPSESSPVGGEPAVEDAVDVDGNDIGIVMPQLEEHSDTEGLNEQPVIPQQLLNSRESPASGKKSPHTGPSFVDVGISPPQLKQEPRGTERATPNADGGARMSVIGTRKHVDKETVASSVELPTDSKRRGPLATPSNVNLQQQQQQSESDNSSGLMSVNKPRLGGRRHHMDSRSVDTAPAGNSLAYSHLHRPDRPDRESIPRPDPVLGHKVPIRAVEQQPKSTHREREQQQRASAGAEREEKQTMSHQQDLADSSDLMWANEGVMRPNNLESKQTPDHSVNYSMSRELDDEFRGLNELMESFMMRTQDNYFYSRHDEQFVVQKQQQQKVFMTKKTSKKKAKSVHKSIFGPPARVPYNSGISPDSSAVDDSLFSNSNLDEPYYFRQGGPQMSEAITSPVKMAREEADNDLDMTAVTTSSTTMSVVDNSYLDDSTGGEAVIAFNSRNELDDGTLSLEEDMKEVTLSCAPLDFTTLVLTFRNQRKRPMTLKSSAILVRFDKLGQFWDANKSSCNQSSLLAPSGSVFQVSPRVLKLEPGARANLYLTFSPNQEAQGIYSGALKIKSNGKSFVLLLRGEARREGDNRALLEGPDMADASVQANFDTSHPAPQGIDETLGTSSGRINGSSHRELNEPFHVPQLQPRVPSSYYTQSGFGMGGYTEEVSIGGDNLLVSSENLSTRGKWLQKWVKKERGTKSEDFDLIAVPDTVSLDSHGHGMLIIESKSSLAVDVDLSFPEGISMSDSKARIAPLGKFRVSLFSTSLSQYGNDAVNSIVSPTKSHVCFLTVTTVEDQRDYIIDIRRGYKSPPKKSTGFAGDGGGASMVTPQKTFLWPSVTQSLGTVDRVSQTLQLETPLRNLPPTSRSVFFRTNVLNFRGPLNMLTRERVDLCNTTDQQMNVRIEDPDLPFVLLHNEISIDAKSYVSVPIRFVPVSRREYSSALHGSTWDGKHSFSVSLLGTPEN